ncbi:MAG: PilZ domain-containing protein [Novosphingobium pentaromativorans]|uniref:PilZ domain-containing protein n=1 Tax=Novosphingobium pentaromativorans TaxID=205844 RepID=A0A2W5NXR5_9SPHN|nr:MAG: PilZ domain-containing protein [Novosphingobium pentaromativorans]
MNRPFLQRRSRRQPVSLAAQCRTANGLRDQGEISDITAEGCCLRVTGLFFRVGMRLVIRPQGLEGLTGIVRWVTGNCAGVEFDCPLYTPVVDHLVRLHATFTPEWRAVG